MLSFDEIARMTREQAVMVVGVRAWDIAHLTMLINQGIDTVPEPPAKPPSFFVSYRWESEAHQRWVARLVHDLKGRGYDVYFDQDVQTECHETMPVPELVSLVLRCNRLLMVLTEGYLERIQPNAARGTLKDGWVWDEYQMAIHLAKIGRLKSWLVVRRSGELPDWVSADQVWDFRDDSRYEELLAEAFPQQFVNVIGVRPDGSTRVAGPIERVRLNEVGRQLEAIEKFDHFLIEHL
jgi:hypothetical protein